MLLSTRRYPPKGTAVSRSLKVQRESPQMSPTAWQGGHRQKSRYWLLWRVFSRKYCNSILGLIFLLSQFPCFYPKSQIPTVSDMDSVALSWCICDRWWLLQRVLPQHVVSCSGWERESPLGFKLIFQCPMFLQRKMAHVRNTGAWI